MFVPKVKIHQVTILLPLKKMFFGVMVVLCSFLQAGNKKNSAERKNFERPAEIYILEGTVISGADQLYNSEIKTIKKDIVVDKTIVKRPLRKSQIAIKEKNVADKRKAGDLSCYRIEISNQDQDKKYKSWIFNELQAIKENGQHTSDFSFFIRLLFLRLPSEKTKINFFSISGKTFLPDQYSCIRPPPGSAAYYKIVHKT